MHFTRTGTQLRSVPVGEGFVSKSYMRKFLKITIIVFGVSIVLIVGITFWIFRPQVPVGSEIIPREVLMEQENLKTEVTAQILKGEMIDSFNLLGSNQRFYLSLKYRNSRHLILRDLSEGSGAYEGGVIGLRWLDNNRLYIERIVGDQRSDLIYDILSKNWQDVMNE